MLSLSRRGCIATWKLTAAKRQTWQRRRLSEASHERHRRAGSESRATSIGDINYEKTASSEARKEARRKSRATETGKASPAAASPKRERARQWLHGELAQGPKEAQAVETAAAKARIDDVLLSQARSDLGIVASRVNTGGVHAVQWSLPG